MPDSRTDLEVSLKILTSHLHQSQLRPLRDPAGTDSRKCLTRFSVPLRLYLQYLARTTVHAMAGIRAITEARIIALAFAGTALRTLGL